MTSQVGLIKLAAAALAGSAIGVMLERMPHATDCTVPVSADAGLALSAGRQAGANLIPDQANLAGKHQPFKIPEINGKVSAENFRQSAKFGLPSRDNLRVFNDFILSYDRRLRAPAWVFEHLTAEKLRDKEATSRSRSRFHEDFVIHEFFRAKDGDFLNSGFDRGHMAAAGNHKNSQDDLDQTFTLSNISPQVPEMNRGAWEKLERYVRWRTNRAKNLYVVTGPLFVPQMGKDGNLYMIYRVLGSNHVSVPTHYFKVFLVEEADSSFSLEAFMMPNDRALTADIKLDDYRVPLAKLDVVERASGVIFFDQLPRNKLRAPMALPEAFKDQPHPARAPRLAAN